MRKNGRIAILAAVAAVAFPGILAAQGASPYAAANGEALDWLRGRIVPNATIPEPQAERRHFVLSYEIPPESPDYRYISGRSIVYDDALAVIAFTMAKDYRSALSVLSALRRNARDDGGFWFGYNTQNAWPSAEDSVGAIERSGATAWLGYSAVYYLRSRDSDEPGYLSANKEAKAILAMARSVAEYLIGLQVKDARDIRYGLVLGGRASYAFAYVGTGVEEILDEDPIEWVSAEHNIDAFFFFRDLGRLTGDPRYADVAALIRDGLFRLWDASKGQYSQGFKAAARDTILALDCASWGAIFSLSTGKGDYAGTCAKAIESRYRSDGLASDSDTGSGVKVAGYKPYARAPVYEGAPDEVFRFYFPGERDPTWKKFRAVWSEGSFGVAMAYLKLGKRDEAARIIDEMLKLRSPGGGFRYCSREIPHLFVTYPSVASTAWFSIVASAWADPAVLESFWGE